MNKTSRIITGMVMIVIGLFLMILSFFVGEAMWVSLIYGVPILIIGIVILFNKKEDEIEGRKDKRRSKK